MTIEQIKSTILNRSKRLEICPVIQQVNIAATKEDLVNAGFDIVEWLYQTGVIDDSIIDEFTDAELNAKGIYKNGGTINNPVSDVCFIQSGIATLNISNSDKRNVTITGDVSVIVNLSGNSNVEIRIGKTASVTINASDNAYIKIKCQNNSQVILNAIEQVAGEIEVVNQSTLNLEQRNNSTLQVTVSDFATLNFNGYDNSYCKTRSYNNSIVSYQIQGLSEFEIMAFNRSTIQNNSDL